ncbi:MAG: CRTAC1 family protein [Steroidobacteraceae bacterium]
MAASVLGLYATSASAQIAFDDVSSAAGFDNTGTETWGVAWGDYDGDGYPDLFNNNHRTRATLHRNNHNGTFTEVSRQVDVSRTPGWTGGRSDVDTHGAVFVDIDNDGDQDLYESVSSDVDVLHINDGGVMVNANSQWGVGRITDSASRMALFMDYNGDGLLDLVNLGLNSPRIIPQIPGNTFGIGSQYEKPLACTSDAQWGHITDIHPTPGFEMVCAPRIGKYPKVNAFSNGTVTDVTSSFGQYGPINDAAVLDWNGDLQPDLFLVRGSERPSDAYQSTPNYFETQLITAANKTKAVTFKTSGILTITASLRAGSDPEGYPGYIDVGSFNWSPSALTFTLDPANSITWGLNSGSPGFNMGYDRNTGTWTIQQGNRSYNYSYIQVSSSEPITDLTFIGASGSDIGYKPQMLASSPSGLALNTKAGFNTNVRCQSVVSGDFDNDMDEDLYLVCSGGANNIPNRLFMNNGVGKKFTEVPNAGGAAGLVGQAVSEHAGSGDSVVVADYDLDGFLDLFVTNGSNMRPLYIGGNKQLFHNRGNGNHWMEFDLEGTTSNRDAIGSKVYVTSGGITQYREAVGGFHRWSQNFKRVHVGLAGNTQADITVQWPDGTSTTYTGLDANHLYKLRQDGTYSSFTG